MAGGTKLVERQQDGQLQWLDLRKLADRHVHPSWVHTIHATFYTDSRAKLAEALGEILGCDIARDWQV